MPGGQLDDIASVVEQVRSISRENERLFQQLVAGEERMRSLAKSVWHVQEDERRRIARELHDGIGQTLTALRNQLERLLRLATDEETARELGAAVELSSQALQDTRELSRLLRPAVLDDLGLEPALRWLARTMNQGAGLVVDLAVTGLDTRLPSDLETLVFRISQEALTNIVKHARVHEAELALDVGSDRLHLRIADRGDGFDADDPDHVPGTGLSSIRDRVELFAGRLELDSRRGAGTRITIDVPLAYSGRRDGTGAKS